MAKVILIDPKGTQGYESGEAACPNVGIAYLVSSLKESGHEVEIIDMNNSLVSNKYMLSLVNESHPDIIGISAKTATIKSAREIASLIKEFVPSVKIIVGGPHITLTYTNFKDKQWFDALIIGEAEESFPLLCKCIENAKNPEEIPGVFNIRLKNYNGNFPSYIPRPTELDKIPYPDYSLFPIPVKERIIHKYPLLTSRGCVFKCTYCSVPLLSGKKFRVRSFDNIFKEITDAIDKYNIKGFEIIDDVFNLNIKRAKEFCKKLIERKINLTWHCPNGIRADCLDEDLARLMYKAGCTDVYIGIESADLNVFSSIRKGETLKEIESGIKMLKEAGICVNGFFIIGLPGDTIESVMHSIEFAAKNNIKPIFNMLVPYPGTELYDWVKDNGKWLTKIEEGVHFNTQLEHKVVFETDDFKKKDRLRAWELANFRAASFSMLWPKKSLAIYKLLKFFLFCWKYNIFGTLRLPFLKNKVKNRLKEIIYSLSWKYPYEKVFGSWLRKEKT